MIGVNISSVISKKEEFGSLYHQKLNKCVISLFNFEYQVLLDVVLPFFLDIFISLFGIFGGLCDLFDWICFIRDILISLVLYLTHNDCGIFCEGYDKNLVNLGGVGHHDNLLGRIIHFCNLISVNIVHLDGLVLELDGDHVGRLLVKVCLVAESVDDLRIFDGGVEIKLDFLENLIHELFLKSCVIHLSLLGDFFVYFLRRILFLTLLFFITKYWFLFLLWGLNFQLLSNNFGLLKI